MRLQFALPLLFVAGIGAAGRQPGVDLALRGAKVYPSPMEPVVEDGTIIIHNGRIAAVGPRQTVPIPPGATVLDCRGRVAVAGFWNSHVHLFPPALLHARDAGALQLERQLDMMFNRWGFTSVFDVASDLDNTLALRRRIEIGELRGPRILTVGEPIWPIEPVYVRGFLKEHNLHFPNTETPEEAVALVRDHVAKHVDGIKLFTGSYQGQGKVAALPLPIAKAAVAEAHRHRLPVFAHPQDDNGVNVAIESGVDILAHTVPQSPPWTPVSVSRLKRANMALIPTLTLFDFEARKDNASDQERETWINRMVEEVRAYSGGGGEVLFGTDIGYIDNYDTTLEFMLLSQAGMTYREILASLTTNPARRFHESTRRGRIAPGFDADVVILAGDPARDVTAFSKVAYTICGGRPLYPSTVGRPAK